MAKMVKASRLVREVDVFRFDPDKETMVEDKITISGDMRLSTLERLQNKLRREQGDSSIVVRNVTTTRQVYAYPFDKFIELEGIQVYTKLDDSKSKGIKED